MTDTIHTAPQPRDPLLFAAQGILWFFIVVLSFGGVIAALGVPLVAIVQDQIVAEMAADGISAGPEAIGALMILLASAAAFLALAVYFLILLLRIVKSVRQGDPFVAENAQRLSRMGWVALAGQVAMIPLTAMALWLEDTIGDERGLNIESDITVNGSGIILVLILFILARVFRKGAEMRDELEGTV